MANFKVLTYDNLDVIKSYIDVNDAKSLKTATIEGNVLKLYNVSEPVGTTEPVYTITLPETDISGLLAKLTTTNAGNIVVTKVDGTIEDGGIKLADLATDEELKGVSDDLDALEELVGTIPDGYDATTIAEYAKELADNVAANGYDDTDVKNSIGNLTTLKTTEKGSLVGAVNELSDGKADKATTIAGYGITDTYTKTEVDTAIANAEHLKRSIVDTLPEVASADIHTIYMVKKATGANDQQYDEYMLINGVFEKIGDSTVDLTDYTTKTYVDGLNTAMDTRVTKLETDMPVVEAITEAELTALFTV